jgi:hypothetical protein
MLVVDLVVGKVAVLKVRVVHRVNHGCCHLVYTYVKPGPLGCTLRMLELLVAAR